MVAFKSTTIEFEGQLQRIDDLISRARFYAQTNRAYSLEVIIHLQDHAHQFGDSALFEVCRDLMLFVNSASPYPIRHNSLYAGDKNNRPKTVYHEPPGLPYDNSLDDIFDERVNVQAVKNMLDKLTFKKNGRVHWYVVYIVFLHLKWLKENCQQKAFLQWVNLQFHCGWTKRIHFTFSRDVDKVMRDTDVSFWNMLDNTTYTKGNTYYRFAVHLRNTFEVVIINDIVLKEPAKDFTSGKNRDKSEFMAIPGQFINWGK